MASEQVNFMGTETHPLQNSIKGRIKEMKAVVRGSRAKLIHLKADCEEEKEMGRREEGEGRKGETEQGEREIGGRREERRRS